MPRPKRIIIADMPHHVIQRGNNRAQIFFEDADRETYLRILKAGLDKTGVALHAYVLMGNHTHLLATPPDPTALSRLMQYVGGTYVQYINEKLDRSGTLFEGRFRSSVVDRDAYFFMCSRYIEENPVRAGLCKGPDKYRWSSYAANVEGRHDPLVTPHALYSALAKTAIDQARAYARLFESRWNKADLEALTTTIEKFHPFGSDAFLNQIRNTFGHGALPGRHGGDRKSKQFRGKNQGV